MLTEHQVNITDFMYMRSTRFYLARTRDIDIRLKCGASILCSHKIIRNIRLGYSKEKHTGISILITSRNPHVLFIRRTNYATRRQ